MMPTVSCQLSLVQLSLAQVSLAQASLAQVSLAQGGALRLAIPAGLLLLATLPVIVWLHMRRRVRRRIRVPSVTPWLVLLAVPQRRKMIPKSWLLVMHVLAASFLALAVAGPTLIGATQPTADRVVVLDTTTSMSAGTRWAEAQALVRELATATPGDFSLVALGPRARAVVVREREVLAVEDAIEGLSPSGSGADLDGALHLAGQLAGDDAEIVVITDGGIVTGNDAVDAHRWQVVGEPVANAAIVAAGSSGSPGARQLYVRARFFGEGQAPATLQLFLDGTVADERHVQLRPGEALEYLWTVPPSASAAEVHLTAGDSMATDDVAMVPLEPRKLRLEIVGDSPAVERAVEALPDVEVSRAGGASYHTDGTVDVTVFIGDVPDDLPPGGIVVFRPVGDRWTVGEGEAAGGLPASTGSDGAAISAASAHPITAGLDFGSATLSGATEVRVPAWGQAIVTDGGVPVAFAGEREGRRIAVLAFDPDGGSLSSRLAFPLLVARAVDWVSPQVVDGVIGLGEEAPLPPGIYDVRGPDRIFRDVSGVFRGTHMPGAYSATSARASAPRVIHFAVMAGDEEESDTSTLREPPALEGTPSTSGAASGRGFWPWLAAAAAVVLLAEGAWRARAVDSEGSDS